MLGSSEVGSLLMTLSSNPTIMPLCPYEDVGLVVSRVTIFRSHINVEMWMKRTLKEGTESSVFSDASVMDLGLRVFDLVVC